MVVIFCDRVGAQSSRTSYPSPRLLRFRTQRCERPATSYATAGGWSLVPVRPFAGPQTFTGDEAEGVGFHARTVR